MTNFKTFFELLFEDLQSSLTTAKNILKNNDVEDYEQLTRGLEQIYQNVQIENPENRRANVDSNIPALAYMLLGGLSLDTISQEYNTYCNNRDLWNENALGVYLNDIKNEIQKNKWFKPSEEKLNYIGNRTGQLVTKIHQYNKVNVTTPDETVKDDENTVYGDNKIIIFLADSMNKCIYYGRNSRLCISGRGAGNYYYRYRFGLMGSGDAKSPMTTYFIYWKDENGNIIENERILVDSLQNGKLSWNPIEPNEDTLISKEELVSKFPDLSIPLESGVFKFIPLEEAEKRAKEIYDNVKTILSDELKTFNDYDIFVQLRPDAIKNDDWDKLELPLKYKKILFKKFLATGRLVKPELFLKYGDKNDLQWYEDIVSRNEDYSTHYYLLNNGRVSNSKIIEHYNKEVERVKQIENEIRRECVDGVYEGNLKLNGRNLYFLPNLEDIRVEFNFFCNDNNLTSLKGSPEKVGGDFYCSDNQLTSLEGAPEKVGGSFYCYDNPLTSLEGAPKMVGRNFQFSNNLLTSLKGAPEKIDGSFYCTRNQLTSLEGAPKMVGGDFHCSHNRLTSLKGSPEKVGGDFYCSDNQLTSLEGAPKMVGVSFYCVRNQLTSLDGAPKMIGGSFHCPENRITSLKGSPGKVGGDFSCYRNQLKSLEGAPKMVEGSFYCFNNQITSLKGAPKMVGFNFNCSDNQLTSLEGAPKMVGVDFDCYDNQLTSLEGAPKMIGRNFNCRGNRLTSLEGAPKMVGGSFYCSDNQLTSLKGAPGEYSQEMKDWATQFQAELKQKIKSGQMNESKKSDITFDMICERILELRS